jgi:PAS domain S-box-containing protein
MELMIKIYPALMLFSATICALLAYFVWLRRSAPGAKGYFFFLCGLMVWSLALFCEYLAPDLSTKMFFRRFLVFGSTVTCLGWFLFVIGYTRQVIARWVLAVYWGVLAIFPLAAVSNDLHHWFWQSAELVSGGFVRYYFGPLNWLSFVVGNFVIMSGITFMVIAMYKKPAQFGRSGAILLTSVLIPWSFSMVVPFLFDGPVETSRSLIFLNLSMSFTPLVFSFSNVFVVWSIFRNNLFDLLPAARGTLVDSLPDCVFVLDENKQIVDLNPAAIELLGLPVSQLVGVPADQVLGGVSGLAGALAAGRPQAEVTTTFPRCWYEANMSPILDRSGQPKGFLLILRDISSYKKAEAVLYQREQEFRKLFESNPFPQGITHRIDGRLVVWNQAVLDFLQMPVDSPRTINVIDHYVHPEKRAKILEDIAQKGASLGNELELVTVKNEKRAALVNIYPIRFQDEDCLLFGLADITELRRMQEQNLEQARSLAMHEEQDRLGRELHDSLGQVMSYMKLQTAAIGEDLEKGDVATASAALARMNLVVLDANTDIREFIRGAFSQQEVRAGFFGALRHYTQRFGEFSALKVILSLPDENLEHYLSSEAKLQLLRIIQEALTNIRKHAHAQSVRIVFSRSEDILQILIVDDGAGLDKNKLAAEKVGFGLDIMRERAVQVGGSLEVRSEPGQGVELVVQLPVYKPRAHPLLGRMDILLVDDHPLVLEAMHHLFNTGGLHVVGEARNGEEALALANEMPLDLALVDMHMPDLSGPETVRQLKKIQPKLKVVMLSVSVSAGELSEALEAGADGYLLKSLSADEFFACLAKLTQGELALAPQAMQVFRINQASRKNPFDTLSERQRDVIRRVLDGQTYKEIGADLHLSEHTARYHLDQAMDQLGLNSRAELKALALNNNLIKSNP